MANVLIRNLSDETHRALKLHAEKHGRSTEAEIRAILDEAMKPEEPIKLGTALREFGVKFGGIDIDFERDQNPIEPATFE
ncbi:FitA-like ribbon-helix-helix domain-containing protein [Rhizobium alvei]|uniref:Arc family DNA-binding protein n=1 Tax=Rhizobium alvei TaxID=1132659 RepID=A0ABT8YL54_9HYPH|nr:Arc family DNA-binding protein [Rhizobium alvei]MDO6964407.1 Arc family DNA-binding protein [Rhizobium alvei]